MIPSDAGSARQTVEAIRGFSSSAPRRGRGCGPGLRRSGRVFGRLQYLSPPLRARKNLDRHPSYILAAYMASGT
jgi:hypothetical protein